MYKIIERKKRNADNDYVLIDRGEGQGWGSDAAFRWVVGTVPTGQTEGEWFWGHYFNSLSDAVGFFNRQPERRIRLCMVCDMYHLEGTPCD